MTLTITSGSPHTLSCHRVRIRYAKHHTTQPAQHGMPSRNRFTHGGRSRKLGKSQETDEEETATRLRNERRFQQAKLRAAKRRALEAQKNSRLFSELKKLIQETPDCEKPFGILSLSDIRECRWMGLSTQAAWDKLEASGDAKEVHCKLFILEVTGFRANKECNLADFDTEMQPRETFQSYFARLKTTLKWIDSPRDESEEGNAETEQECAQQE